MILVDTSVWIDFLTGRQSPYRRELHRLVERGAELSITGIILQEILQGIRSDLESHKTEKHLMEFHYLPLREPQTFRHAALLYRECARKGKQIRKPVDALIAAQALEANAELFHHDRDFDHIAAVSPLKLYRIPQE